MKLSRIIARLRTRRDPVTLELRRTPSPPAEAGVPPEEEWQKRLRAIDQHVKDSSRRTRLAYLGRPLVTQPEEEPHHGR